MTLSIKARVVAVKRAMDTYYPMTLGESYDAAYEQYRRTLDAKRAEYDKALAAFNTLSDEARRGRVRPVLELPDPPHAPNDPTAPDFTKPSQHEVLKVTCAPTSHDEEDPAALDSWRCVPAGVIQLAVHDVEAWPLFVEGRLLRIDFSEDDSQ